MFSIYKLVLVQSQVQSLISFQLVLVESWCYSELRYVHGGGWLLVCQYLGEVLTFSLALF